MTSLLRVMYAPLDYVHPQRFSKPEGELSSSLQQAVNHHLIRTYDLPTEMDFKVGPQDFSQRLVDNWNLISQVAWLLGCKIARGNLAMTGQLAALPSVVHRFIALPIPCPAYPADVPLSKSDVEQIGARYVNQLQPQLPRALAERLPLVFAPDETLDAQKSSAIPALTLNRSLFTFAFDYAQNPSN